MLIGGYRHGVAMGSPLGPVWANIFMSDSTLKKNGLLTAGPDFTLHFGIDMLMTLFPCLTVKTLLLNF